MIELSSPAVGAMVVLALLAASAFFSATEIAVFSLPASWPSPSAGEATGSRVRTLAALRSDPHRLLVTLLVGNNLVNVALTSVVTVAVAAVLPPGQAVVVATLLASATVLVFGEILPKSYGLGHAESWALAAARPLRAIGTLLFPIVVVFDAVTGWLGRPLGGDREIEEPYVD